MHPDTIRKLADADAVADLLRHAGWQATISTFGILTTSPEIVLTTDAPDRWIRAAVAEVYA